MDCRTETLPGLRREVRQAALLPHRPRPGAGARRAAAPTRAATRSGAARCETLRRARRAQRRDLGAPRPSAAAAQLTWNENLLVADDGGHIGWWHPGLLPLRPKRWDERLPLPGTGEAEWRGLLPRQGAAEGDRPAAGLHRATGTTCRRRAGPTATRRRRRRNEGDLHRGAFLQRWCCARPATARSTALKAIERRIGTTAQQRPLLDARLRAARRGRDRPGARPCSTRSSPGTATTTAPTPRARSTPAWPRSRRSRRPSRTRCRAAAVRWLGQRGGSHPFDIGAAEAAALPRRSTPPGSCAAAGDAAAALAARFGTRRPGGVARAAQALRRRGPGRRADAAAGVLRPRDVLAGGRARALAGPSSEPGARPLGGQGREDAAGRAHGVGDAARGARRGRRATARAGARPSCARPSACGARSACRRRSCTGAARSGRAASSHARRQRRAGGRPRSGSRSCRARLPRPRPRGDPQRGAAAAGRPRLAAPARSPAVTARGGDASRPVATTGIVGRGVGGGARRRRWSRSPARAGAGRRRRR